MEVIEWLPTMTRYFNSLYILKWNVNAGVQDVQLSMKKLYFLGTMQCKTLILMRRFVDGFVEEYEFRYRFQFSSNSTLFSKTSRVSCATEIKIPTPNPFVRCSVIFNSEGEH
jgi:hypothetical protein